MYCSTCLHLTIFLIMQANRRPKENKERNYHEINDVRVDLCMIEIQISSYNVH